MDDGLARAMQKTLSLCQYPGSHGTPGANQQMVATPTKYVNFPAKFFSLECDNSIVGSWP
jgi:hypothetical protein